MQSQLIFGIFSGYGESALDRVCIVCTLTIRVNSSNLLQPLPWNLAQPVHPVTTEVESQAAEESQGPTRLHKESPRLHQLHLKLDTCKYRVLIRNRHIYPLVLSLMSTHTLSISCSA
jgi:hypothetical protein